MANLDRDKIAKIKQGEILGWVCLAAAGAGVIFFAVCYPIARVEDIYSLLLLSYILSPILVGGGAIGSALCNFTFGASEDRLINKYVVDTCLENPQAMHPERTSLTFFIDMDGSAFTMHANGYSDKLVFDFSPFGKLTPMRKSTIANAICVKLTETFCRLYDRGAKYSDVGYMLSYGRKKTKNIPIISNGVPDKKSYKIYLKTK